MNVYRDELLATESNLIQMWQALGVELEPLSTVHERTMQRIRELIARQPAAQEAPGRVVAEPVAWQYRLHFLNDAGGTTEWAECSQNFTGYPEHGDLVLSEKRALYSHPPQSAGVPGSVVGMQYRYPTDRGAWSNWIHMDIGYASATPEAKAKCETRALAVFQPVPTAVIEAAERVHRHDNDDSVSYADTGLIRDYLKSLQGAGHEG